MNPVVSRKIADLSTDPANVRTHDEYNLEAVKASLRRFGFQSPIVIDSDGVVRAGNARLEAAKQLGLEEVPCVVTDLEGADAVAYALADNRTAELADWDGEALKRIVSELDEDLQRAAGFLFEGEEEIDWSELDEEASGAGGWGEGGKLDGMQDVAAPELEEEEVSELGDVWCLGDHMLVHGDSTTAEAYPDEADMVFTDPPYGVSYVGKTADALTIENDGSDGFESAVKPALLLAVQNTADGGGVYVCGPPGPDGVGFFSLLKDIGVLRQILVWVKSVLVMGRSDYHYRHESISYGWRPGAAHRFYADRKQDTVWEFDKPKSSDIHPTMKPVPLVAKAILCSSQPGELVLDPFSGSGTTIIAAEKTERRAWGIEISGKYVDASIRRWQTHTNKKATLQATGQTFEEVEAERLGEEE